MVKLFFLILSLLWCLVGYSQCKPDSAELRRKEAAIKTERFILLVDAAGNTMVIAIDSIKAGQAFLLRSWDFVKNKPKCAL